MDALAAVGFVRVPGPFATREEAWRAAGEIVGQGSVELPVEVIGDFVEGVRASVCEAGDG